MSILLNQACAYYRGLEHQTAAFDYLESKLSEEQLRLFARRYRNTQTDGTPIKLSDAAKYYLKLTHQDHALDELQKLISADVLEQFAAIYRSGRSASRPAIKLKVPYRSQLDNDPTHHGPGYRQCNLTSHTMLLLTISERFRKASSKYNEPESYYGEILKNYGDTTDHSAHTSALHYLGIKSAWITDGTHSDIRKSLELGVPVVAGVRYRSSGHIIVIVGDDPDNQFYWVHDPYGTRIGASDEYQVGVGGAYDKYTYQTMQTILYDAPDRGAWIRLVLEVDQQKAKKM